MMSNSSGRLPVTVLGLGPMGRALTRAFAAAGHPTTIWNRTPGRAGDLVERGAVLAATAEQVIGASDLVIVCVLDHDAVHAIVEPAATALKGRTPVNLTADSPDRARSTAAWAAEHGIGYLDGAIMVPTTVVGTDDSLVLLSGPAELHERHRGAFEALGGTTVHLGDDPGLAAAHDIALLDVFWTAMSGIVHAFALARAEGIPAAALAPYAKGISGLLPGIIDTFAHQIDTGDHPGDGSNLRSATAGMAHVVHAAHARGLDTSVLGAAYDLARREVDAGHGDDGFAFLVESVGARR
jgi:3-hydroxyisobutyrate dehydrogenase-like beta-hydroxyacid dehydrogenase